MIAAINAGLEQGLFSLTAATTAGRETGLSIDSQSVRNCPPLRVWQTPVLVTGYRCSRESRGEGESSVGVHAWSGFWAKVSDAHASGWLERAKGQWLQTDGKPMCYFRRDIIPALAGVSVQPKGTRPKGAL